MTTTRTTTCAAVTTTVEAVIDADVTIVGVTTAVIRGTAATRVGAGRATENAVISTGIATSAKMTVAAAIVTAAAGVAVVSVDAGRAAAGGGDAAAADPPATIGVNGSEAPPAYGVFDAAAVLHWHEVWPQSFCVVAMLS